MRPAGRPTRSRHRSYAGGFMRPALTRSLLLAVLSCLSALRLVVTSPLFDYDPASCLSNIDVEDEVRAVGVEERRRVLRHADQAATGDDESGGPVLPPSRRKLRLSRVVWIKGWRRRRGDGGGDLGAPMPLTHTEYASASL